MLGSFGNSEFGSTEFLRTKKAIGGAIALLGDVSSHGGTVITSGQDNSLLAVGGIVAVEGALHECVIVGHGVTSIIATTVKTFHNGKLILTNGAKAGCGALIKTPSRNVLIEK